MRTKQTEEVTVKIPKGIEDGTSIKLKEKGSAGIRGGKHGDLYVHVRVFAHKNFLRDGANIHSEENIHVLQAILGANIKVDTVHGKVDLKIPAGIQSGTELSIKGKGAPSIRSDKMGDHILKVNVKIPEKLSKKEKELFSALAKESKVNVKDEGFFDGIF
jgi:molecular chaperone DnaJ